jgi:hypothetical protein
MFPANTNSCRFQMVNITGAYYREKATPNDKKSALGAEARWLDPLK